MIRVFKHKGYKFMLDVLDNGYYIVRPCNFKTLAIIMSSNMQDCLKQTRDYLNRVIHYNGGVI